MITLKRAFKNILRSRIRTLLVSLVLALCVAVFVSTIAGVEASESATAEMLDEYGEAAEATIEQTELAMTAIMVRAGMSFSEGGPPSGAFGEEPIDEEVVDEISSMDDVEAVVPTVSAGIGEGGEGQAGFQGEGGGGFFVTRFDYMITGVPLDSTLDEKYQYLPVNIVDGRNLEEGDSDAVLISEDLTDYFGAGVGDSIEIEGSSFEVAGVYLSTMMNNEVYMDLAAAQDMLGMEGEVSSLTVYAESASAVDDVVDEIESEYPDFMVMAMSDMQSQFGDVIQREQERVLGSLDENLANIQSLGLSITIVSVIIGVLLIFGLMFYTVRERTKEIGTLKAIGFSNPEIMKQFMYEGLYTGLIGGVIGLAIAAAASSLLSSWLLNPSATLAVSTHVTLFSVLLGIGVAIAAGALGSLYPAWRASRVSPMEALRRE
ncbi:MAG: ABC transporter permease [Chloroflexota bacterium]|nr:ABC transporter permease [Chloroflexota bacterium]